MSDIFLIYAPEISKKQRFHPQRGLYPNLGIHSIFSYLVENEVEFAYKNVLDGSILSLDQILDKLKRSSNVSIAGFSVSITNYLSTRLISEEIRKHFSEAKIVYGGPLASTMPEAILQNNPFVDGIVAGDGENIFLKIVKECSTDFSAPGYYYKKNGNVIIPRDKINHLDINHLPYPLKNVPNLDQYFKNAKKNPNYEHRRSTSTYFHKTGCDQHCVFCQIPYLGKIGRDRSPEEAWREVQYLNRKFGVNHIYEISDNILYSYNKKYSWFNEYVELSDKFNKNRDIHFRFYASVDRIDEDMLTKFIKMGGDTLSIGFESNDDQILQAAKSFSTSSKMNERVLDLISHYGLNLVAFFVLGLPGETKQSLSKTYEFIKKVADYHGTEQILAAICMPLPKTKIWRKFIKKDKYLRNKYFLNEKTGHLIEPTWTVNEITKDFIENCEDIHVSYNEIKKTQNKIYRLRPEIFSTWEEEDFNG